MTISFTNTLKIQAYPQKESSSFYDAYFQAHLNVAHQTQEAVRDAFHHMVECCLNTLRKGGKLMFFGNGGSAADAQHLAAELTVRYKQDRPPLAAIALTTDTSVLTAAGNDFGFETIFERQIEALATPHDTVIGISTSGHSPNVLRGLEKARNLGLTTIAFTGESGGSLPGKVDILIQVPSLVTSHIQEMHITLGQMLCHALEVQMGLVEELRHG